MDDKPPPSRRSSGHSEKSKKSAKKKKKNKHKDRKRGKLNSSPDETNSDSACFDTGQGHRSPNRRDSNKKSISSSRPSLSTSKSSTSVGVRKSKSNSSSGSDIRSQNDYLERCVSDIFERRRQTSTLTLTSPSRSGSRIDVRKSGSRISANGRESAAAATRDDVDEVCEAVNESLRWDHPCSDPEEEQERIRVYKINRRKRYMMDVVKQRNDKEGVLKFARELASLDAR